MSIIDDDHELDRILENTYFDEYELIDLPMEQLEGSAQENSGVGTAPTYGQYGAAPRYCRTVRRGWHPVKGVQGNFPLELTLSKGLLCLPFNA